MTTTINVQLSTLLLLVVGVCVVGSPAVAEDEPKPLAGLSSIEIYPAEFKLLGNRSRQQIVVTGNFGSDDIRDITHLVELQSTNSAIVRMDGSIAMPTANGDAEVIAIAGELNSQAKVTVSRTDQPEPVSFKNEMLAALTKSGCNMGACHGSPSGKAGFRLSLRGYDPPLDILTLRTEYFGRRANVMDPAQSLILRKPLMEVAHGGGRRLFKGDASYNVLHGWISEGLKLDAETTPDVVRIEVFPRQRVQHDAGSQQQLTVTSFLSDGTTRDVTALTVFSSSNEQVATVNAAGLVEKTGRGETAVLARYLDKMGTSDITFLEQVPGFVWNKPTEHNFVDQLVFAKLKQLQILPSEMCSDSEFIRRAYLDATGRLPTIAETNAFLAVDTDDRRAKLIDRLLDSDDFAAFWTLKWGDILRSNSKKLNKTGVHKFHRWLYDSIRTDKPLDQFAHELLTASGSVYENPAANYWRASRDPNDATETTAQLFLGIRIQCAKCHNHPFERWSQDNYYGIAAAFTRVGRKKGPIADDEIIFVSDSGEIKQPRTGQTMRVHLLLKGDVDVPAETDRRAVFADWLTNGDNPFFARASVNRIWGHLMGRGIVEPVDDFRDSNPPSNSQLLDELEKQFVANKFSRKWAIRTIMNSRVYQLGSRTNRFNANDEIYASHATVRLLTAEQLLDAICVVTGLPEKFAGLPSGMRAVELPDPPTNHYFLKIFGQPQREMACQCERSSESNLSQALQMINGPVVHNKLRDDKGRIKLMMDDKKSDDEIITTLYLAALARKPIAEELAAAKKHIANTKQRRQALEDVGWAVLNSKEFLFQH
jgi:hypothetical protein